MYIMGYYYYYLSFVIMSRIIVKNLPKGVNEEEIRKVFAVKGTVTDVKVMKTKDGKERNFCFVGFKDDNMAKEAIKYFNGTYIRTAKVVVEAAKLQNDPTLKRKGKGKDNKGKGKDDKEGEEEGLMTKESKIQKIIELSQQTKNADKFDKATTTQQQQGEDINASGDKANANTNTNVNTTTTTTTNDNNKDKELQLNPKRLYLRNIPFEITDDDITSHFSQYGTITETHIPRNPKTNASFGYAYISYETIDSSIMALSKMDGKYFLGRRLHISISTEKPSKPQPPPLSTQPPHPTSSYKQHKLTERKRNYNNETNWNYLFLNQNAVIDNISARLGIPKSEILNKENADIAVQISAMETTIINETKEWLAHEGINLEVLKGKRSDCIRSKTIIFIKNINTRVQKENLEKIFSRYGSLVRFMLSPSNTLAICEYVNAKHAANCMKHLAYYEIEGEPIYLEYAPEGIMLLEKKKKEEKEQKTEMNVNDGSSNDDINLMQNQGKVLFVSNLNFSTKDKALKHFFESKDYHVDKVEIASHLKNGKSVSSGYGFVQFKNEETMLKALKHLQGFLLEGHSIKLSIAKTSSNSVNTSSNVLQHKRKRENEVNDYEYENELTHDNTKLLVKNLAFEATKDELRKLFKVYGQVKTVRLPLKLDGSHRGFAFVEFLSHDEAMKAFKELQNTHFYGRKIVIEWAEKESTVESLREKTKRKANLIGVQTHKTQKKGEIKFK